MFDLSFLISLLVLGVITLITYKVYIWPYYISDLRKVPGPPSENLLYGHFKTTLKEPSSDLYLKWAQKYGNVVKFHGILNNPEIVVTDVKIVQEILNQAYEFPKYTGSLADSKKIIGDGIIFAEGQTHKKQRRLMNPAFSHNNIKEMVPTLLRVGSTLKGLIEDKLDKEGSKIILTPHTSKATLDAIGLVGFNYEFNSLTSQNSELEKAYGTVLSLPISGIPIIISILSNYIPFIRKLPLNANKKFNDSIKVIERISKKLIEEREDEVKNKKLNRIDILSLLISGTDESEERLTSNELRNQIMSFMLAGHETVNMATCWILYLLAQHPHEQDLLREELIKAFPDKSKINPTYDEINSLEYLNCIIKETLRLYSPVGSFNRCTAKDTVLGNYLIPKNTKIVVAVGAIQRLPSIWGPTAEDFDPKRWLDPSLVEDVTNYNYLPFSSGPRICIGNKLAMIELKVLSIILIRNFVFQPVEGLEVKKRGGPLNRPVPYVEFVTSKVES